MLRWLLHLPIPLLILAAIAYMIIPVGTNGHVKSLDGQMADNIAGFFSVYKHLSNGEVAANWGELIEKCQLELDDRKTGTNPTVRYAILSPPLPLAGELSGHLVAMNRSGIHDVESRSRLKGPGRYLVYQDAENTFHSKWVREKQVQAIFMAAGRSLPEPDSEAERPWVVKKRWSIYIWRMFATLVIAGAIYQIWGDTMDEWFYQIKAAWRKRLTAKTQ